MPMKLLLVYASAKDAQLMLDKLQESAEASAVNPELPSPGAWYKYHWLGMDLDLLISGPSTLETSFHVGRVLASGLYHLALQLGTCISLDEKATPIKLLNVINDKPGDLGLWENMEWKDAYASGLLNIEDAPHQRGGFINLTNAYFNVFVDLEKVAAITVNSHNSSDKAMAAARRKSYGAQVESLNGLGMTYACLWYKQRFYQLRVPLPIGYNKEEEMSALAYLQEQCLTILPLIA